jgi:hypothetical protein
MAVQFAGGTDALQVGRTKRRGVGAYHVVCPSFDTLHTLGRVADARSEQHVQRLLVSVLLYFASETKVRVACAVRQNN